MGANREEPSFQPIINVTEGDMQYALRHDRYNCAIVRAIQRQYPEANRVRVDTEMISFSLDDDRRYMFPTPQPAIDKIIKPFDKEGPEAVKPVKFKLSHGYSRPVEHADSETRKARKFAMRASKGEHRERTVADHNQGCARYRFAEDAPEE